MYQDNTLDLKAKITPLIIKEGFELVELKLLTLGRKQTLSILADRPGGGINIDECAALNRKISSLIEKDPYLLENDYVIEVSSPGIGRPFTAKDDFLKAINSNLNILLNSPMKTASGMKEKQEFNAELIEVRDEDIYLNTKDGALIVPFRNIKKAKQVIR